MKIRELSSLQQSAKKRIQKFLQQNAAKTHTKIILDMSGDATH
jgi:hypothetical protein